MLRQKRLPVWGPATVLLHFHYRPPRPLQALNPALRRQGERASVHRSATWSSGPRGDRSPKFPTSVAILLGFPEFPPAPLRSHPTGFCPLESTRQGGRSNKTNGRVGRDSASRGPAPLDGADRGPIRWMTLDDVMGLGRCAGPAPSPPFLSHLKVNSRFIPSPALYPFPLQGEISAPRLETSKTGDAFHDLPWGQPLEQGSPVKLISG